MNVKYRKIKVILCFLVSLKNHTWKLSKGNVVMLYRFYEALQISCFTWYYATEKRKYNITVINVGMHFFFVYM